MATVVLRFAHFSMIPRPHVAAVCGDAAKPLDPPAFSRRLEEIAALCGQGIAASALTRGFCAALTGSPPFAGRAKRSRPGRFRPHARCRRRVAAQAQAINKSL